MTRRFAQIAAAFFSLAGVVALATRRALRGPSVFDNAAETLTPIRVQARQAVEQVVPSVYPDQKFRTMAPSFKPEDPAWREALTKIGVNPDAYTTCGELPRYVGERLTPAVHTRGGLSSIRDLGLANGAWIVATGKNRPKLGDFYLLAKDAAGKEIVHTGVVIDASGSTWKTADAGQGTDHVHQAAAYVDRAWDPAAITLGTLNGPHFLAGWYDIDKGASPPIA